MSQYKYILLISLLALPYTVYATDQWAVDEFVAALDNCDRGLAMSPPQSQGSLSILQILLKKYQMSSTEALEKDSSLKSLPNPYNGNTLKSLTFAEAYQRCETQLPEKVRNAEVEIKQRIEIRLRKLAEQQAAAEQLAAQIQQAETHAFNAIEQGCNHLQLTEDTAINSFPQYTQEKQQALQLYPEIGQQLAPNLQQHIETKLKISKNIAYWFQECDALFARLLPQPAPPPESSPTSSFSPSPTLPYTANLPQIAIVPATELVPTPLNLPKMAEKVTHTLAITALRSPDPPNSPALLIESEVLSPELKIEEEDVINTIVAAQESSETELAEKKYQELLTKAQGDRLKVLQIEKRLPDAVDGRDMDYHKATRWQYQKTALSGKDKCVIYSFANNRLTRTKEFSGQCP